MLKSILTMKYSMYMIPLRTKKGGGKNKLSSQTKLSTSLPGHHGMPGPTWSLVPPVNWGKETDIQEGSVKQHGISLGRDMQCTMSHLNTQNIC